MSNVPTVTVLIPARNEQSDIGRCLRAVLAQDYPHDRMEVVLVDGGSWDRTAAVAKETLAGCDIEWRILENVRGTTPSSLNAGLAVAKGELLCRVDARSLVPPAYVRLCSEVLTTRPWIAVVGGAQLAVAVDGATTSAGIARALNNRFAMGGSRYRSGAASGPSDTVYLGAFRVHQLRAAGGWDDYFETNQDFELNRRMSSRGVVWFDDGLAVGYVPRQSLLALWEQYHRFGRWKVRYWHRTGNAPEGRQLVSLMSPLAGMVIGAFLTATARKPLRAFARCVGAALFGLLAVDALGSKDPKPPSLGERLVSATASGVVAHAWVSGVLREAALRRAKCLTT